MKTDDEIILIEIWDKGTHVGFERLTEKGWQWRYFAIDPDNGERWCDGVIVGDYEIERLIVKKP